MRGGGGCQQYFLLKNNAFSFHVFFAFYAISNFEKNKNFGGVEKQLWCLLLNLLAGDLGRPSCLVCIIILLVLNGKFLHFSFVFYTIPIIFVHK